ncbi:MAG: O-antigen ligase family protein [Candidatus Yanofskybacteria bacterium]|nr:O-antigen ligase family protein [Candidatus Yanofskybacteria bacterium]
MKESILARIIRYGVYLIAFVPLIIFSQYISPFHFGKVVVFRSIVEILLVLYLLLIWRDRSYLPRKSLILWTVLAFTTAFSISTLFGVQQYFSFWGTLERMGGLWSFWHYVIFFIIATSVFKTREQWYSLLNISIFVSILSSLYGFGQKTNISFFIGSGGRERIFGTIGNAALFSGYILINLFLAITLFFRADRKQWEKIFLITAIVINTLAIIMATVRGTLMGLGAGLAVFTMLYYLEFRSKTAKRIFLALMAGLGIFIFVLITPIKSSNFVQQSRFLHRITDTSFDSYTAKTRFWAWQAGLEGWKDTPKTMLVGWGPESFNIPFSKRFNPNFFTGPGSETFFDRAHNMFVEVLVTMGVLGLLAYISIFWGTFRSLNKIARANKGDRIFKIGFISLLVAYVIHNSFIFDTSANFIAFFTVLGFIMFLDVSRVEIAKKVPEIKKHWLQIPATVALMVGAIVLAYRTNIRMAEANYATTRGIIQSWANDFNGAVEKFKESMAYDVPGKYEYRNRFAQYVLEFASGKKLTPELTSAVEFALSEINKNVDENPPDYLPLLYASRLHIILGKEDPASPHNDQALQYSLRALDLSPTFVRTYYEVAQAYLNKKDLNNAALYFKHAAELNPEVGLSFWYWGITEYERGNTDLGVKIARQSLDKRFVALGEGDYVRLANLLIQTNDLHGLVLVYEQLVGTNPSNAQYWASLAVSYARVGMIDKAVESARKTVELDPNFRNDAEAFLRGLGRQL